MDLKLVDAWMRVERSLGLLDDAALSVRKSGRVLARSRSLLDGRSETERLRLFSRRLDGACPEPAFVPRERPLSPEEWVA